MLTRIKIRNFKSFDELSVNLDRFNVLVGANASGKSNFVQIFRFLSDIANHGLENAIALQGDARYFRNVNLPPTRNFYLSLHSTFRLNENHIIVFATIKFLKNQIMIQPEAIDYTLEIRFTRKGGDFEVVEESLKIEYNFFRIVGDNEVTTGKKGDVTVSVKKGKLHYQVELPESLPLEEDDIVPGYWRGQNLPEKSSLLEMSSRIPVFQLERFFTNIHIYDFDPKAMKKAVPISGIKELEQDGSNIALVLKNLLEDKTKKQRFLTLMQDLLPFIQDMKIAKFADKSLHFSTQEKYTDQYLPGFLLSDGTVILTALVYALFFSTPKIVGEMPLVILEEPAQHIHPSLISRMLQLIEEASESQQIIITTHNPEIVKHTPLDRLLLISRDERGFSTIKRPAEKQEVKTFLENEIGIEELFLQNLLE